MLRQCCALKRNRKPRRERERERGTRGESEKKAGRKDGNNEVLFSLLVFNEACIRSFRQAIGRESTFGNNDVLCLCFTRAAFPSLSLSLSLFLSHQVSSCRGRKRSRSRVVENISRGRIRASRVLRVPPFTRAANSTRSPSARVSLSRPFSRIGSLVADEPTPPPSPIPVPESTRIIIGNLE